MIDIKSYSDEHIRTLQCSSKKDPALLERTIFAFGLLEALTRVGLPFTFKGGTCLILLMDRPRRLSTDIDIIVEPGTDLDDYIKRASEIFPFEKVEEQKRIGKNNIVKRHFKFIYNSPVNKKEFYILLDVLFENNNYVRIVQKDILNDLLLTMPDYYSVNIPSVACILADKLTAFAPHTTGIPLNKGKDMEVIKQFYDVSSLIDVLEEQSDVLPTYVKIAKAECDYRGINASPAECLQDTYNTAFCIASRGKEFSNEYPVLVQGIHGLKGHIYSENFTPEVAANIATKVMYFVLCLLKGKEFIPVTDENEFVNYKISSFRLSSLSRLRKTNLEAYSYAAKIDQLLSEQV